MRKYRIAKTIIECQRFSKFHDFLKTWDELIATLEDEAFKKGIKQAERILKKEMRT